MLLTALTTPKMCGIIGFIPKDPKAKNTGKYIIEQYQRQLSRGQRGFGLMSIYENKVIIDRATEPVKALLDARDSTAPIQFFHHRMPTSTENEIEQTHPFLISHDELGFDYYVIHNGVIRNPHELMKIHTEELGYAYNTLQKSEINESQYGYHNTYNKFNDSETLAIEAARYFDGKSEDIGCFGTIAFIVIRMAKKTHKPIDILWSRNKGNPLEMVETKHGLLIASEVYHEDAELITENTFEIIKLKDYFKNKKPHTKIYKLIKVGDVNYREAPPVVIPPTIVRTVGSLHTHNQNSIGFNRNSIHSIDIQSTDIQKTQYGNYENQISLELNAREKAFLTMADRVVADINVDIYEFFDELAYNDMSDEEIMLLSNSLNDMLIEKTEAARKKVRPFFDKKEEMETDIDNDDDIPTPNREQMAAMEEDIAQTSLNERMNASAKRFREITN